MIQTPQPHTGSYYAATANRSTEYSSLKGEQTANVCIIGAGFTGISTALFLAERGYKVAVVEANKIGWGASGRNGGQMIGGISGEAKLAKSIGRESEKILWDMGWAGHEIIRERVKTYNIDCDLKSGYVDGAIKPRHVADLQAWRDQLERLNFPHEFKLLSKQETEESLGTKAYIGALQNQSNGHLHPLNLCL